MAPSGMYTSASSLSGGVTISYPRLSGSPSRPTGNVLKVSSVPTVVSPLALLAIARNSYVVLDSSAPSWMDTPTPSPVAPTLAEDVLVQLEDAKHASPLLPYSNT